jgi:hypothetical protein
MNEEQWILPTLEEFATENSLYNDSIIETYQVSSIVLEIFNAAAVIISIFQLFRDIMVKNETKNIRILDASTEFRRSTYFIQAELKMNNRKILFVPLSFDEIVDMEWYF